MNKSLKILVVDDSPGIRDTLVELLERGWGHTVRSAINGQEAIAFITNDSGGTDLVITDQDMPGGADGQDVVRAAKKQGMKAVLMSGGYAEEDGRAIASSAGADSFLAKPFGFDKLRGVIVELFPEQVEPGGER